MVDKKGSVDSGMVILTFVLMGIFIVGAMASQTSTIFSSFASSEWGIIGFVVKYFNIILFVGLTLTLFVGFGAMRN